MPHVFDQESGLHEPTLYKNSRSTTTPTVNNGKIVYGASTSTVGGQSQFYIEYTDGEVLTSMSLMKNQVSLKPHAYNGGNYYNRPSGIGDITNTVCPHGWSLPVDNGYNNLVTIYNFLNTPSNKDSAFLNLPLSFLRSGYYSNSGSLSYQGSYGRYRMTSRSLLFDSGGLDPTNGTGADRGYSVRCVSK